MQSLPDKNNLYAVFQKVSKEEIKEIFVMHGWQYRKSAWNEYYLSNEWSELLLTGSDEEPLLNGAIIYEEKNIDLLNKALERLKGQFGYEVYDDDKIVLLEKKMS